MGSSSSIRVHAVVQFAYGRTARRNPLDKVLAQPHVVEPSLLFHRQQGKCVPRGNIPVQFRSAMPCSLYTFTRNRPDEGESFL